jgi:diguanylate cyclase (GGDEF)-like protein
MPQSADFSAQIARITAALAAGEGDHLVAIISLLQQALADNDTDLFQSTEALFDYHSLETKPQLAAISPLLALKVSAAQLDRRGMLAHLNRRLAWINDFCGDEETAIDLLREAESGFDALGDKAGLARCANNLCVMWTRRNNFIEAERNMQVCLTLNQALGKPFEVMRAKVNYGHLCEKLGAPHWPKGIALLQSVLEEAKLHDNAFLPLVTSMNLARLLALSGQPEAAEQHLQTCERLQPQSSNIMMQEAALVRGWIARDAGQLERALAYFNECETICRAAQLNREACHALTDMAHLAAQSGQYQLAYEASQRLQQLERGLVLDRMQVKEATRAATQQATEAIRRADEARARELALRETLNALQQTQSALAAADREKSALLSLLERQSLEDALTGVPNRRALDLALEKATQRATRLSERLWFAIADIDHFKAINDTYSHSTGDRVLREVAQTLKANCREQDYLARYGGEEFVLIFTDLDATAVLELCNRLRLAASLADVNAMGLPKAPTLSFGLAQWQAGEQATNALARADTALYAAKRGGRNQVLLA